MNPKKILSEWFIITFGTVIAASAVFFFLIPSHLAVGSISGLAIILANFIPLKISAITMGLNVALLVVGLLLIGRDFGIKTIYTSVLMPCGFGGSGNSVSGHAVHYGRCVFRYAALHFYGQHRSGDSI